MQYIFKFIKNILFILVLAIGVYMLSALVLSLIKTQPQKINCIDKIQVFVRTNGIHLDIVIPADALERGFAKQLNLARRTEFVAFGWGDKDFYINTPQWKDLTASTAFKAVFLKSATAMHVRSFRQESPAWRKTEICPAQLNVLLKYISNTFRKDADGKIKKIDVKGYSSNDSFYDARGSFSLFKTCNNWVNIALKRAAVETSVWSPFDFGVLHHLPVSIVPPSTL